MREPVERLLQGEPAVAEREAQRGQRLVEQPRPGRRARHVAVEQQALHVLGKLVGAEGPALLQPGAVAGEAPALLQPAREKVVVDLVELELEEDRVRGNLREALLDGLVEAPGLRGRHVARAQQARIAEQPRQALMEPLIGLDRVRQLPAVEFREPALPALLYGAGLGMGGLEVAGGIGTVGRAVEVGQVPDRQRGALALGIGHC